MESRAGLEPIEPVDVDRGLTRKLHDSSLGAQRGIWKLVRRMARRSGDGYSPGIAVNNECDAERLIRDCRVPSHVDGDCCGWGRAVLAQVLRLEWRVMGSGQGLEL